MPTRLLQLDADIRAAGIPIDGVALLDPASAPPTVRIDFQASATQAQRTQAQSIVSGFDWTPRRPRPLATLRTEITNLTQAQRNTLLIMIAADFLREHPRAAEALGISISGDEPAT